MVMHRLPRAANDTNENQDKCDWRQGNHEWRWECLRSGPGDHEHERFLDRRGTEGVTDDGDLICPGGELAELRQSAVRRVWTEVEAILYKTYDEAALGARNLNRLDVGAGGIAGLKCHEVASGRFSGPERKAPGLRARKCRQEEYQCRDEGSRVHNTGDRAAFGPRPAWYKIGNMLGAAQISA